jgi:predicted RNase H-like HicB family nuclease
MCTWSTLLLTQYAQSVHKRAQSDTFGHNLTMKFPTVIYQDEDGAWVVECPAIPGCVSQGQTREEAMENIKEATMLCLEVRAEHGIT